MDIRKHKHTVFPIMSDLSFATFRLHPLGYVQHWLVTGPHSIPYKGAIKDDDSFRRDAVDFSRVEPPQSAIFGAEGPFGSPWRFYYPGRNYFVEYSNFWSSPSVIDLYASTQIDVKEAGKFPAHLWAAGSTDLWVNGMHITRFDFPRYMHPDFESIKVPLRAGSNHLCVRLQVAAIRDTRFLFGLQFLDSPKINVHVPGAATFADPIRWLDRVKAKGLDSVVSELPAPLPAKVILPDGQSRQWPAGEKGISFVPTRPGSFEVRINCQGQEIERHFEIPANRDGLPDGIPADRQQAHLDYIASAPDTEFVPGVHYSQNPLLARRLLGRTSPLDAISFATMIQYINERRDCSDFALATLLRLVRIGLATPQEEAEIKHMALDFRYWFDEPGSDAMCFGSENHSLLFHGCQFMAGQMYSDEIFSNTGRTGKEQAIHGLRRTETWLEEIEAKGFGEFLSSTYVPITVGALLNVVDFSSDPGLSRRASALVDQFYKDLADHTFHGLTIGPQGRVYRNVLNPEEAGTQALLSWATSEALPDFSRRDLKPRERTGDWMTFLASSKSYRPPDGLEERMRHPVSRRYTQAGVEIVLHKTRDYILTSLAVPRGSGKGGPRPGGAGYQEHLWQATLGVGCHIFVNHPGCSFDVDKLSRPGYWYGNGTLPVVRQREGVLEAIFNIADGTKSNTGSLERHPIAFTHAHWPTDAFEKQEAIGQWIFGQRETGYVGLWCSEKIEPIDDILTGRELRASGYRSAWVLVCGGASSGDSFETFIQSCLAQTPEFDHENLVLRMKNEEPLSWPLQGMA